MSGETNRLVALAHEMQEHPIRASWTSSLPPANSNHRPAGHGPEASALTPRATPAGRLPSKPTLPTPVPASKASTTKNACRPRRGQSRYRSRFPRHQQRRQYLNPRPRRLRYLRRCALPQPSKPMNAKFIYRRRRRLQPIRASKHATGRSHPKNDRIGQPRLKVYKSAP